MVLKKMVAGRFMIVAQSAVTENICEKSRKVTGTQIRSSFGTLEYEEVLIVILNFIPEIALPVSEECNGRNEDLSESKDR
jgi:hypothetical protein